MRKILFRIFCWLLLLFTLPASFWAIRTLSDRRTTGAFAAGDSWCGVLRLWIAKEDPLYPWLERQAYLFAKKTPGVRVHCEQVAQQDLLSSQTAEYPPDMVVCLPGTFDQAERLIDLQTGQSFLPIMSSSDLQKSVPLAMDSYFWIVRADLSVAPGDPQYPATALTQCPADCEDACYSAALLALFSGFAEESSAAEPLPGADLGLPAEAPTSSPAQSVPLQMPSLVPANFHSIDDAVALFCKNECDAFCATATELQRLQARHDQGKAPDFHLYTSGTAFSDRIWLLTALQSEEPRREELCRQFAAFLTGEAAQAELSRVHLFRATRGASLYTAGSMALLEEFLSGGVIAPPCFANQWRQAAAFALNQCFQGKAKPADLFSQLFP